MLQVCRLFVTALGVLCAFEFAAAQEPAVEADPGTVSNWTAPPYWVPTQRPELEKLKESGVLSPMATEAVPSGPLPFFAIAPCRVVDTRPSQGFGGAYGPPIMAANAIRTFDINSGPCPGIPAGAEAYSLNFAVTETAGAPGDIRVFPTGSGVSITSVLNWNFVGNGAIANAIIIPAGTNGAIDVQVAGFNTHLVIDINGYYAPISIVNTVNGLSGAVTLAAGTSISITPSGQTLTIATDATAGNTPSTLVRRDASGDFSAGTVALSGNLTLPATSSDAGHLVQSGTPLLHTFGTLNVFLGPNAGNFTMTGPGNNTAIGAFALSSNTMGGLNTATGVLALSNNTTGLNNTANGQGALQNNENGDFNTALGTFALFNNSSGDGNIAIGYNAGGNLTTGSDNIDIGSGAGAAGESGTIRIGTGGTQTRAFLAGVRGVTTGVADGLAVLIDSNGQLGTISSSASVKRQITDVGEASSPLQNLRPVSFFYRNDTAGIRQYGLIAEEAARIMPELVQFSPAGEPETVRYHFLTPLLLNELQKEQRRSEDQESRIEKLLARLDALEARLSACPASTP